MTATCATTSHRRSSEEKDKSKSLSHKLEKKLGFYKKVVVAAASDPKRKISKKKRLRSRQKKLKAYDLSSLSEFLPDLQPLKVTDLKLNCKSRQKLVQSEGAQLRLVLNDRSFQTNPLAAIHQYLERTQPSPPVSREKPTGKNRKKTKRKAAKGPLSGSQSMDF